MTTIKPLRNTVMFKFLDVTGGKMGKFTNTTKSGIILTSGGTDQKTNRWGQVLHVGPEAEVEPGQFILIESLMWMEGTEVDGVKMWKTDSSKILCVTDDEADCISQ